MIQLNNPSFDSLGSDGKPLTRRNRGEMGVEYPDGWLFGWQDDKLLYDSNARGMLDGALRRFTQPYSMCNKLGTYNYPDKSPVLKPEFNVIQPISPYLVPPRVYENKGNAIKVFKQWGIIEAWAYQTVKVDPFKTYQVRFSAFAHAWFRSNEDNDAGMPASKSTGVPGPFFALFGTTGLSDNERNYLFDVGIDPLGGSDPLAPSVEWGLGAHIVNAYFPIPRVTAIVGSGSFTVFIRVRNLYGLLNSDAYIDNALLEVEELPGPTGPAPLNYVAIPFLPPQNAALAELNSLQAFAEKDKRDVIRSYDSARAIVRAAMPGSKVILVGDVSRHPNGIVEWLGTSVEWMPFPKAEPPTPPPAIQGGSKLGAHVLLMNDDAARFIEAGPSVVKFAGDWGSARLCSANTVVVGRQVCDFDAQSQRAEGQTPARSAKKFVDTQRQTYTLNPGIGYWEGHNESVWGDLDGMSWFAQHEIERMKLMEGLGLKCVIGNFSTGCPPLDLWPAFLPACQYARDHGHLLGLHEYGRGWLWWMTGKYQVDPSEDCRTSDGRLAGWTALRYRQVYDKYLSPAGLGDLQLVITEFGLDGLVNPEPAGCPAMPWRGLGTWWKFNPLPRPEGVPAYTSNAQYYAEQLKWFDREMRQDPYVLGATIFTYGNFGGDWAAFDVTGGNGCASLVTEYVKAEQTETPRPPPTPTPTPTLVLRGLHMRPDGELRDSDYMCVQRGNIKAAKLMTSNPPWTVDRLAALGVQPANVLVRLFADLSDRVVTPTMFCDWMFGPIQDFMSRGVHRFEIHNEPNLPSDGLGLSWQTATSFSIWYGQVLSSLKARFPSALFGFPGLSPQSNWDEWADVCRAVMLQSDFVCAHSYWVDPAKMGDVEHGGFWKRYLTVVPGKPLVISEFSNPLPGVAMVEKGWQYKKYYASLTSPVIAAHCFISSAPTFPNEAWIDEMGASTGVLEGMC